MRVEPQGILVTVDILANATVACNGHSYIKVLQPRCVSRWNSQRSIDTYREQTLNDVPAPSLRFVRHAPHVEPPDHDGMRTERNCLEDIGPSADAGVEENGHLWTDISAS